MEDRTHRYRAFISYAHADGVWARWLHRALEGFTVPKELRAATGPDRRFSPVFRDEEELAALADLTDGIRAALRDSENLIVVCSPAAARSRWVAEEVRYFRETLGRERVFALIVDGEPGGEGDCFPPGVRDAGREPLAADVRAGRDRETAKLKLLAGMLGVGFDELRDRDARRRQRRLTRIVGASVTMTVVMTGLTAAALLARQEASRQRESAELARTLAEREAETARQVASFAVGLFELADPGKGGGVELTARALADRGARMLETQIGTDSRVRAELEWTLGNVYRGLGRYVEAEEHLRRALEHHSAAAIAPDARSAALVLDLAAAVASDGRYADAERLARDALALAERLESEPEVHRARRDLGGYLRLDGRLAEAREVLTPALALAEHDPFELARTRATAARLLHAMGEDVDARVLIEQALPVLEDRLGADDRDVLATLRAYAEILRHLGQDPMAVWQRVIASEERLLGPDHPNLADSYDNMAIALFLTDTAKAKEAFERALAIRARSLPPNHTDTGISHNNLGYFAVTERDWSVARKHLEKALDIQRNALGDDHPEVARIMTNLGAVHVELDQLDEASALLTRAVEVRRRALGADHIDVAHSLIELGKLRVEQGQARAALATYEEAARIVEAARAKALSVGFVERQLAEARAAALKQLEGIDNSRVTEPLRPAEPPDAGT